MPRGCVAAEFELIVTLLHLKSRLNRESFIQEKTVKIYKVARRHQSDRLGRYRYGDDSNLVEYGLFLYP